MTKRDKRPALKRLAEDRGLTLRDLAKRFGNSRQTIANWFTGKQTPNTLEAVTLADLLGITRDDLDKELRKVAR